jgi:hypothetical protein
VPVRVRAKQTKLNPHGKAYNLFHHNSSYNWKLHLNSQHIITIFSITTFAQVVCIWVSCAKGSSFICKAAAEVAVVTVTAKLSNPMGLRPKGRNYFQKTAHLFQQIFFSKSRERF